MSYTKRQFVTDALEEIAVADYDFDLQPEQLQSALRKLDTMMATWNAKGLRLSYPIPSSPENSNLDDETNVPDSANEAIITNLAIRLAPSYGKQVSIDTKQAAYAAYNALLSQSAQPREMQITGLPKGAGSKYWRNSADPFLDEPEDLLEAGNDSLLDLY